jgi:hypothetical protein
MPIASRPGYEADRLQTTAAEVHLDALQSPDPCGVGLIALLNALQRHASAEGNLVDVYARLVRQVRDPLVACTLQLVMCDQERDRRLFQALEQHLHDRFVWADSLRAQTLDREQLGRVREFEEQERQTGRNLRDLAHRARCAGDPLVSALLESVATDRDRHAHLLHVVSDRFR